jgi:hypothetical protein
MFVEPEMEPLPCNNHVELGNVVDIDMVNAEFEMNERCFGCQAMFWLILLKQMS